MDSRKESTRESDARAGGGSSREIRRPFVSELKSAFRSPTLSPSNRPLTLKTTSPFVSQVILSIFPSEGFRWHRRKSAPIAGMHGNSDSSSNRLILGTLAQNVRTTSRNFAESRKQPGGPLRFEAVLIDS